MCVWADPDAPGVGTLCSNGAMVWCIVLCVVVQDVKEWVKANPGQALHETLATPPRTRFMRDVLHTIV